jgi:hypothetical protein
MPDNDELNPGGSPSLARVLWNNTAGGKPHSETGPNVNGHVDTGFAPGHLGDQRRVAETNGGQGMLTSHPAVPALPGPPFGFSPTKRDNNGTHLAVWPAASPLPAAHTSFGAVEPSTRNPRKRAWADEDDDGISDRNDFMPSSDDVMMTDDASPSIPTRTSYPLVSQNYNGFGSRPPYFDQVPDSPLRSNGDRQLDSDGGMVGRMKRVRMNDASDSEDL